MMLLLLSSQSVLSLCLFKFITLKNLINNIKISSGITLKIMNPSRYAYFLVIVCLFASVSADGSGETSSLDTIMTKSQRWGFGLGASLVISSLGFLMSAVMIMILKSKRLSAPTLKYIIIFLVAFAVGALLGDAVIHIMPDIFSGEEDEGVDGSPPKSAITSLFILVGFGFFIFIEKLFEWSGVAHSHGPMDDVHDHGHGHGDHHHHHHHHEEKAKCSVKTDSDSEVKKRESQMVVGEGAEAETPKSPSDIEVNGVKKENSASQETLDLNQNKGSTCFGTLFSLKNRKTTGIMVLMADFLHNTMDGLAIGVAFSSGNKHLAVSTFVAILAHEVPKEISGMGVLVDSKFPLMQALCCNGVFQFTALIGAVIGLAIGSVNAAVNAYILAFVAGNFLYISLVSMVPIVMREKRPKHSAGLLLAFMMGAGVMFAILAAEDD